MSKKYYCIICDCLRANKNQICDSCSALDRKQLGLRLCYTANRHLIQLCFEKNMTTVWIDRLCEDLWNCKNPYELLYLTKPQRICLLQCLFGNASVYDIQTDLEEIKKP